MNSLPWFHGLFHPALLEKLSPSDCNLKESPLMSCSTPVSSVLSADPLLSEVLSTRHRLLSWFLRFREKDQNHPCFKSKRHICDHSRADYPDYCLKQWLLPSVSLLHLLSCLSPCVSAPPASSSMSVTRFHI